MFTSLAHRILNSENDRKSLLNFVISICFILLFFHIRYGLGILNPSETAWLMKYDWAQHYMGWYFFRFEPWTFPLGNIHNLFYPIGTNIGFTDSVPLAAIPLKLLSPLLPEQFQYHGFWLFLTHVLVAFFSIRLFNRLNIRGVAQLFATLLIVFNPALLHRAMHIALASHWVVVANLWIYFLDPKIISKRRILTYQFLLLIAGGLINPYFALINGGFLFILALKFWLSDKILSPIQAMSYVASSAILLVVSWLITGFFNLSSTSYLGVLNAYGQFSWNLSSLFNPYTYDRFEDYYTHNLSSYLPARELVRWEQYEAFSYLGLGVIILSMLVILTGLLYAPVRRLLIDMFRKTSIILLFTLTLLITLFAISNIVTYNDKVLFSFPLPGFTKLFTDIFRASGRYIWSFYYLWFFFIVFIAARTLRKDSYLALALFLVCAVQLMDIRPMIFNRKLVYEPYQIKINEPLWDRIAKFSDKLLFLPPLQSNYLMHDDWRYFSWVAAKNRKPVSVGHVARIDFQASYDFAKLMLTQIQQQKLDSTAVYITRAESYSQFLSNYFAKKVDIILLDGYMVIARTDHKYKELMDVFLEIKQTTDQSYIQQHFAWNVPQLIRETIPKDNERLKSGMYEVAEGSNSYTIRGWCFLDDKTQADDSIKVFIRAPNNQVLYVPTNRFATQDVADFFHNDQLKQAGFETVVDVSKLATGYYQLGLQVNRFNDGKRINAQSKWLDTFVRINNPTEPSSVVWKESNDPIRHDINILQFTPNGISIEGWAFHEKKNIPDGEIYVTISRKDTQLAFRTVQVDRPDVSSFFKDPSKIHSGFFVKVDQRKLNPGNYTVGILIRDPKNNVTYHSATSRNFEVKTSNEPGAEILSLVFGAPEKIDNIPDETDNVKAFVDIVFDQKNLLKVEGWGFIDGVDDDDSKISLILEGPHAKYKLPCRRQFRSDLKDALQLSFKTDSSGFSVSFRKADLENGEYDLYLLIQSPNHIGFKSLSKSISF